MFSYIILLVVLNLLFRRSTSTILIEKIVETRKLILKQGISENLTCHTNTNNPQLDLDVFEGNRFIPCLVACEFQSSLPECQRLLNKSLNISCSSGIFCYSQTICNMTIHSPTILLDGLRLACFDYDEQKIEWEINGIFKFGHICIRILYLQ